MCPLLMAKGDKGSLGHKRSGFSAQHAARRYSASTDDYALDKDGEDGSALPAPLVRRWKPTQEKRSLELFEISAQNLEIKSKLETQLWRAPSSRPWRCEFEGE